MFEDVFLGSNSFVIHGEPKSGKFTLLAYLVRILYKEEVVLLSPQEDYLFKRHIKSLCERYPQFTELDTHISSYHLNSDWHSLKQNYGFNIFLQEVEKIIRSSRETIIVIQKIGDYFEFQDRYEIANVYKTCIKLAADYKKKIIFLSNTHDENFEYIKNVAEDFTDIEIFLERKSSTQNILTVKDLLHSHEFPPVLFEISDKRFSLKEVDEHPQETQKEPSNVLVAEFESNQEEIRKMCLYLLDQQKHFSVKQASSMQGILEEIFINPDFIIVFIKRSIQSFETIRAIKKHLPDSRIIAIVDQTFLRSEDVRESFSYGIDELFSSDISIDKFVLSLEKAAKRMFYEERLSHLAYQANLLESLEELQKLIEVCEEHAIFFSLFIFEKEDTDSQVEGTNRKYDYIFQTNEKLYHVAVNTFSLASQQILENYKRVGLKLRLVDGCEATDSVKVQEYIKS